MWGRAGQFRDDLEEYIKFRTECDGKEITPNEVDFEDFMAFLDVEHYLGLRGSDTWSSDGNESQVAVKTLIGEILTAVMPTQDSIPKIYKTVRAGPSTRRHHSHFQLQRPAGACA